MGDDLPPLKGDEDEVTLMARISALQAAEDAEMKAMQRSIDNYEFRQKKESAFDSGSESSELESSSESELEEADPEFLTLNASDPVKLSAQVAQNEAFARFAAPEQRFRIDELTSQNEALQEELRLLVEKNRLLEREGNKKSYLYSNINIAGGDLNQDENDDDMNDLPTAKELSSYLNTRGEVGIEAFAAFCRKEKSSENIEFWKAVRNYVALFNPYDPQFRTNKLIQLPTAQHIVANYVAEGSPFEVNLPAQIRRRIVEEVNAGRCTAGTFNAALEEVVEMMATDTFRRFQNTPIYRKVNKHHQNLHETGSAYTDEIDGMLNEFEEYRRKPNEMEMGEFFKRKTGGTMEDWFHKLTSERTDLMEQLVRSREWEKHQREIEAEKHKTALKAQQAYDALREKESNNDAVASKASKLAGAMVTQFHIGTKKHIRGMRRCCDEIKDELSDSQRVFSGIFHNVGHALGNVVALLDAAQQNYKSEVSKRIKLFDALQDLRGNIRVFCRVRPLLQKEVDKGDTNCIEYLGATQLMIIRNKDMDESKNVLSSQKQYGKSYTFDRVFGPNVDQNRIFTDVKTLVGSVLDGYNVCIFAYGQTGSGKTYTMEGPKENPGINHRAIRSLFDGCRSLSPQYRFQVHVSYLEIYNEKITDLLSQNSTDLDPHSSNVLTRDQTGSLAHADEKDDGNNKNDKLEIRKNARGMYVTNTVHVQVETPDDVLAVVDMGTQNRTTYATNANERSSRSHAILLVTVDGIDQVTLNRTYGKLYLVDLAGSERVKETNSSGQRMVEANYINKSLSALGDVMRVLSERKGKKGAHVPYRNSKLTYLLQDALGGNSKTMMFVNVSPLARHSQETLCSLDFATRVRKVQLDPHQATQNAALQKYKVKLEEMKESARLTTEKLKASLLKVQASLAERDKVILQLNEKLKQTRQKDADSRRKQYLGGAPSGSSWD